MPSLLLWVVAIWIALSLILSFPLANLMHFGSGEGPESLSTRDKDTAGKRPTP